MIKTARKNKRKTSKYIITALLLTALLFTVAMIWLFYKFQSIPDTLVVSFFGAIFGELSVLGMIRTAKVKNEGK